MKRTIRLISIFAFLCVISTSCGVMFGGSKYNGHIIARNHPNADIYVNGAHIGKGTAMGIYKRNNPLIVEVREEGCAPKTEVFGNKFRTGNFILSVVSWGWVGILVDLSSGASWKPDHKNNPAIIKTDIKNFTFAVDYSGCPVKNNSITSVTNE